MARHKDVFLILTFHAHEPWWDLPSRVLSSIEDEDLRNTVPSDNWVRKRASQERDVYKQLIVLAQQLNAPVCLEATNELLMQIEEFMPKTFDRLKAAFSDGSLYPVYGGAHHAHCTLLTTDELADEVRLNQEFLHDVMGAPLPRYKGAFPMEGSADARKLEAFTRNGITYLLVPNLSPRKAHYRFDTPAMPPYQPFAMAEGLIGLPRHFRVSQDIWRPITRWKPEGLRNQGYILGEYPVFEEEYRREARVSFPIPRNEAITEYREVLEQAIHEAPDQGLLLYIQDLELMDYGDEALEILAEAIPSVRAKDTTLHVVSPDDYIERLELTKRELPRLRFYQLSWAPEIRPVLRADGHYPPLDAGPVDGLDFSEEGFRRWPFIYWEWGRWHVALFNQLIASFGLSLTQPLSAADWRSRAYRDQQLTDEEQVALYSRTIKQADNWGWQPDEDRQKRPYLYGIAILDVLLARARESDARAAWVPIDERIFDGLMWLLKPFIDVRVDYLRTGTAALGERVGHDAHWVHEHLSQAEAQRDLAATALKQAITLNERSRGSAEDVPHVLRSLRDHCRHVFLATDHIQRAWGSIADKDGMVLEMYRYLYALYPPLLYRELLALATPEELSLVEDPPLL